MYKPLVMVDVDGVCADFVGAMLKGFGDVYDAYYTRDQVTSFDFSSLPDWENIKTRFWFAPRYPGFCSSIRVFPGARKGIERLRKIARVEFATTAMVTPYWHYERLEWLKRKFKVNPDDVHFTSKKHRLEADVLIDDKLQNVVQFELAGRGRKGLLFDAPYNREAPEWVTRVHNWDEIIHFVKHVHDNTGEVGA